MDRCAIGGAAMNYRNRALLNLAYELDCTLRILGVCEGGRGEPCHANSEVFGKGGAMKAHDFAFASGCRACHREIDQGQGDRQWKFQTWLRGHVETMRQLWERGLLAVATEAQTLSEGATVYRPPTMQKKKRRESRCTAAANQVKRPAGGFSP